MEGKTSHYTFIQNKYSDNNVLKWISIFADNN